MPRARAARAAGAANAVSTRSQHWTSPRCPVSAVVPPVGIGEATKSSASRRHCNKPPRCVRSDSGNMAWTLQDTCNAGTFGVVSELIEWKTSQYIKIVLGEWEIIKIF